MPAASRFAVLTMKLTRNRQWIAVYGILESGIEEWTPIARFEYRKRFCLRQSSGTDHETVP